MHAHVARSTSYLAARCVVRTRTSSARRASGDRQAAHLPYISPHLPYISPTSLPTSRLHLPCISPRWRSSSCASVISNVDAKTHSDPEVIKQILAKQVPCMHTPCAHHVHAPARAGAHMTR